MLFHKKEGLLRVIVSGEGLSVSDMQKGGSRENRCVYTSKFQTNRLLSPPVLFHATDSFQREKSVNKTFSFHLQQLCRDWSKSSQPAPVGQEHPQAGPKTSTGSNKPTAANLAKLQSRDSKDSMNNGSQRSSTSSWPEEPSTTNMDISTGHMVSPIMGLFWIGH